MASDLEAYFRANQGRLIHKWMHYFDIYDRWFHPFRGQPITVIELGVYHGSVGNNKEARDELAART